MMNLDCFFTKEKTALTSTNDDIENLEDILAVKNVVVSVCTDDYYNNVYAYKINKTDCYFEVAESFKDKIRAKAGK